MPSTTVRIDSEVLDALRRYQASHDELHTPSDAVRKLLESEGKRRGNDWFSEAD